MAEAAWYRYHQPPDTALLDDLLTALRAWCTTEPVPQRSCGQYAARRGIFRLDDLELEMYEQEPRYVRRR